MSSGPVAIAGGHRLVTTDRAFGQFAGLEAVVLSGEMKGRVGSGVENGRLALR